MTVEFSRARKYAVPAATLAIAAAFLLTFAGDGLRAHLTGDDLMNSYQYWSHPTREIVTECLSFYPAEVIRPLGALFYGPIYALFGLNPLPYRIVCFAFLLANLALVYLFCARLTKSREVAALACLLGAYHAHLNDLYYNSGTVYDLICCFFFYLAFIYYLQIRERGDYPGLRQCLILLAMYIAALDAKEMAVTLPAILLAYELVCHPPEIPSFSNLRRWAASEGRFIWLTIPVTAGFIGSRMAVSHSMATNPAYHPNISLHMFMTEWRHYLSVLFYQQFEVNTFRVVMFWALLLVVAWIARRRELLIAWFLIFVGVFPVIFIEPRGLYAIYMILPACYLFAAVFLILARDFLVRGVTSAAALLRVPVQKLALFVLVLLLLIPIHQRGKSAVSTAAPLTESVNSVTKQLQAQYPTMPHGAKILFLSDPFDPDDFTLTFLLRLHYRDDSLVVDRAKAMRNAPDVQARRTYQHVFTLTQAGLTEVIEERAAHSGDLTPQ